MKNMKLRHHRQSAWQIRNITVFVVLTLLFMTSAVAQTKNDLPPRILELVPSGTKLITQEFTSSPIIVAASFTAEKNVAIGRTVEYNLQLRVFDNNSPTWKMRESAYRKQMEDRIAEKRSGLTPESANFGMHTADLVKETKYSWGSGLTQRVVNHPPEATQYVTFNCAYYGLIGGVLFELFVSGVPDSPEEGNNWAQKVAEVASRLSISNIGN